MPSIEEVINFKKKHITKTVEQYRKYGNSKSYEDIAKEILINNTPVAALASLLEYTFKSVLNPNRYKEIKVVRESHRSSRRDRKDSFGNNFRKKRSDSNDDSQSNRFNKKPRFKLGRPNSGDNNRGFKSFNKKR